MVFFNYATMQMAAKIVYYGPGLCGKTTNLQYIYANTNQQAKGKMISLATETERTLFFDFLPVDLGPAGVGGGRGKRSGFKPRTGRSAYPPFGVTISNIGLKFSIRPKSSRSFMGWPSILKLCARWPTFFSAPSTSLAMVPTSAIRS